MTHPARRRTFLAFSGGKDSTALAYRMRELGEPFVMLFTPTGNELPGLREHVEATARAVDAELIIPPNRSLDEWITHFNGLPNWRQRWCTRLIKIVPCIEFLKQHEGSTLVVGLRADEEERTGLYGEWATYRYPLREWGWGIKDVYAYLARRGVSIPKRTDCALCYGQRLEEWHALWREHPEEYARGEAYEARTGFTFRSKGRDTWPAGLAALRGEFERGRKLRLRVVQDDDEDSEQKACRVCAG